MNIAGSNMRQQGAVRRVFVAVLVLTAVGAVSRAAGRQDTGSTAAIPEGLRALFNGKDLTGWRGVTAGDVGAEERMKANWSVVDGVLEFDGQGEDLTTVEEFEDFELRVDWKIGPGGDSGIYLRGFPQVQIWDLAPGSGGLFNNEVWANQPLLAADRPVGEWNTFRIFMIANRATVYLNDLPVVDDVALENGWDRREAIARRGPIVLQAHGTPVSFRNVWLRALPSSKRGFGGSGVDFGGKQGALIAIVGDSITEQRQYSVDIEAYMLARAPEMKFRFVQLGWGGERAPGFAARMENDLLPSKPDVVMLCYGMNDGQYRAYEPSIGKTYGEAMRGIVRRLQEAGATVVVGSPGAVDSTTFRPPQVSAEAYNENLAHLRDEAREVAIEFDQPFADVHDEMMVTMKRAKGALGDEYHVAGKDGVHPAPNGHLVMAYAFLRAMGLGGDVAVITADYQRGKWMTGDGHQVIEADVGRAMIESTRYPFCVYGDEKSPDSTRSIVPFVAFNRDLNRFTLRVTGLPTTKAEVRWGSWVKTFSREQLESGRGINLAEEFPENPFSGPFADLIRAVRVKQEYETRMIKECVTNFRSFKAILGDDVQAKTAMSTLRAKLEDRQGVLQEAARAAVKPVRHEIEIVPIADQ